MASLGQIFDKLHLSFTQKGNKNKKIRQEKGALQICQEQGGTMNVFQFQTLNVSNIKELAGFDIPQNAENLLKSAGQRFIAEQQIKQENLKNAIMDSHIEEIEEPNELDKDWFLKWMDIAQGVSKENIQKMLSKIISGEIKKTGAFSLRTLEVLKNLSKEELSIFQEFCNISYSIPQFRDALTCVICEPFGSPGDNSLEKFNLSYTNLTLLHDAGLIQKDLTTWREMKIPLLFNLPFTIGSENLRLVSSVDTVESTPRHKIINFTKAGLELRSILNLEKNDEYLKDFIEWAKNTYKMNLASD
ncbi:MAG: DUF2806 domain-containing protein [Candidatus Pacebacteria bacterium]|nr:DUF2806 domain-containing protein [Candidatus Paceibacterota bacterium]